MSEIPRIVEQDQKDMVAKMATMILGMPRPNTTDAIAIFPGRGEDERLRHAVRKWQARYWTRCFLVAGTEWKLEKTTPQPTLELLKKMTDSLRHPHGVHIQDHAHCTPDQTRWVVQKVQELGIGSLSLVVSPYHLIRAYLTLLKEFLKQKEGPLIPLIPLPAPTWPDDIVPEDKVDAWTLFDGEARRIRDYQKKGDVATLPELKEYLHWLKQQPLFQN